MIRKLTSAEKAFALEVDKTVKNKWTWAWESIVVDVSIGAKKKLVTVKASDSISKIAVAGKAWCDWCTDSIFYGSKGKSAIVNHLKTNKHLRSVETRLTNETLGSFGIPTQKKTFPIFVEAATDNFGKNEPLAVPKIVPVADRVSNMEAMVLATAAEQSWSFTSVPIVIRIAKEMARDPEALNSLSLKRSSASYKMRHGLAESVRLLTIEKLKANKFSLNLDESTSNSGARVLTILVNYFDSDLRILKLEHLASISLIKVDTQSIFSELDKLFVDNSIPWQNCMSVLMDSCAVMRGSKAGLEKRLRDERAPHLLAIDGDICHHIHNASKKFCKPFESWCENLFDDIFNEFHWSVTNQDCLKEICCILGKTYSAPPRFIRHRWLSCFDISQSTLLQLAPITVYLFAFLSQTDRSAYLSIVEAIIRDNDVSKEGRKLLYEIVDKIRVTGGKTPSRDKTPTHCFRQVYS